MSVTRWIVGAVVVVAASIAVWMLAAAGPSPEEAVAPARQDGSAEPAQSPVRSAEQTPAPTSPTAPSAATAPTATPSDPEPEKPPQRAEVEPATRDLRWKVNDWAGEPLPEGTVLHIIQGIQGDSNRHVVSVRVEGNSLVATDVPARAVLDGYAIATADGRRAAVRSSDAERGVGTSFFRARKVEVTLCEDDGRPIVGETVYFDRITGSQITNASGRATFTDVPDGLKSLSLTWHPRVLAPTPVPDGDTHVTWRLPPPREAVLRFTLDGRKVLPSHVDFWCFQATIDVVAREPATAQMRLRVRPFAECDKVYVELGGAGHMPVAFQLPIPRQAATPFDVALRSGAALSARILLPKGFDERELAPPTDPDVPRFMGRPGLGWYQLQRWNEKGQTWDLRTSNCIAAGSDGVLSLPRVEPGRYRVLSSVTLVASPDITVVDGTEPAEAVLDLSRAGRVRGRVTAEGDVPLDVARVVIETPPAAGRADGSRRVAALREDGWFDVWAPGDRAVRIHAEHPWLRADPKSGSVELTEPRADPVLRLVPGPTLSFRVPPGATPKARPQVRCLFFRGEVKGDPVVEATAASTDVPIRMGNFEPGRWTLWIDVGGFAPKTLPDVELGAATTDLGVLALDHGSSIRVKVSAAPGEEQRPVSVRVISTTGPSLERWARAGPEIVVPDLSAGRYSVYVHQASQSREPTPLTVDVDGVHDAVVEWPPR
jgi:hypothetical protein